MSAKAPCSAPRAGYSCGTERRLQRVGVVALVGQREAAGPQPVLQMVMSVRPPKCRHLPGPVTLLLLGPGCVKTLRGITAPGILGPTVMRRAKKRKNLSSARHYDQIRFRFRTAKARSRHSVRKNLGGFGNPSAERVAMVSMPVVAAPAFGTGRADAGRCILGMRIKLVWAARLSEGSGPPQ